MRDRWHSRLYFVKPALQLSLAFLWLFTGLTSLFFYPHKLSFSLLDHVGIPGRLQPIILYSASFLDFFIGLLLLVNYQVRKICLLQFVVILFYMVIITLTLPNLWLDPFGSITKNIPLIVAIYILYILDCDEY